MESQADIKILDVVPLGGLASFLWDDILNRCVWESVCVRVKVPFSQRGVDVLIQCNNVVLSHL